MLDLLGRKVSGDSTLGVFVEFMPQGQLSTMVWFNETCFNLQRDDAPLPLARKKEAFCQPCCLWVGPVSEGTISCGYVYRLYLSLFGSISLPLLHAGPLAC